MPGIGRETGSERASPCWTRLERTPTSIRAARENGRFHLPVKPGERFIGALRERGSAAAGHESLRRRRCTCPGGGLVAPSPRPCSRRCLADFRSPRRARM